MYKNYTWWDANRLARFGGYKGSTIDTGGFYLLVSHSSTISYMDVGVRLIMFGD